jgi:pilus assembly protein CpaE
MSLNLRICLYDPTVSDYAGRFFGLTTDEGRALTASFSRLAGVDVIARCADWQALQEHLKFGQVDVVVVNLDVGANQPRFLPIQQISELAAGVAIFGISQDTGPDTIIAAMRAGCTQFVRAPLDDDDPRAAFDRIRQMRAPASGSSVRIATIGAHGGAGSTTLACNLALELAHVTNRRVGLIDMDMQFGDVACAFDRHPRYSIADVCQADAMIDRTMLEQALDTLAGNVAVLARPEKLQDALNVSDAAVERLYSTLKQVFPFVVTDLPRHFSPATLAAARVATRILIVTQLAVPFIRNAARIWQGLLEDDIEPERIHFIVNRCSAQHERITPTELEKHLGRKVYATIPNDYRRVTASRDLGHAMLAEAPNSPVRLAIQKLAKLLVAELEGESTGSTVSRAPGLLRKLLGRTSA